MVAERPSFARRLFPLGLFYHLGFIDFFLSAAQLTWKRFRLELSPMPIRDSEYLLRIMYGVLSQANPNICRLVVYVVQQSQESITPWLQLKGKSIKKIKSFPRAISTPFTG